MDNCVFFVNQQHGFTVILKPQQLEIKTMNSCIIIVVYFSINSQQWVNIGMKIWNFLWGVSIFGESAFFCEDTYMVDMRGI